MENKSNTLAAVLGGIVVLVIFIVLSFFVGQKIKENFFKPKPTVVTTVIETQSPSLLDNQLNNQPDQKATTAAKYKTIPQTGPEGIILALFPLMGAAGIYLKSLGRIQTS